MLYIHKLKQNSNIVALPGSRKASEMFNSIIQKFIPYMFTCMASSILEQISTILNLSCTKSLNDESI